MNIEDHLRRVLQQAAATPPAEPPAAFERATRRRIARRALAGAVTALAAVLAGAMVITLWPGERPPTGAAGEDGSVAGRYVATGTVLEAPDHGPELCMAVMDSLPPQCRGVPIANWDWERVTGEQQSGGTTWGEYRLVGRYDGSSFTLDQDPTPPRPGGAAGNDGEAPLPCPPPPGGWTAPDPSRATEGDVQAAIGAADAEPDYAGSWISYLEPPDGGVAEDPGPFVLVVTFTGDPERHRRQLGRHWGGPLCLARQRYTYRELERINRELPGFTESVGVQMTSAGLDPTRNVVNLRVLAMTERARDELAARYGEAVAVTQWFQPLD